MKLSTKGRYAVMAMVDLALNASEDRPCTISAIADRQNLSSSYLEQLFMKLRRHNLVQSARGQMGGYFIPHSPESIRMTHIFEAVDEPIEMTLCDPKSRKGCQGTSEKCSTHHLWIGLRNQLSLYLSQVSLQDVCQKNIVSEDMGGI